MARGTPAPDRDHRSLARQLAEDEAAKTAVRLSDEEASEKVRELAVARLAAALGRRLLLRRLRRRWGLRPGTPESRRSPGRSN